MISSTRQLEVGLARDLEALALPDEVLAVEVDAARVDAEELALLRLEVLRLLHLADDAPALVAREHVVARQEVLLEVFLGQH